MPNCLIRQPAGLGDIIFSQKIADMFIQNGYEVWWPVIDEYYEDVKKYIQKDGIEFCRQSDDYPLKEYFSSSIVKPLGVKRTGDMYIPLQYADIAFPDESILKAKYRMVGTTYDGWDAHVMIERDKKAEDRLYKDVLKLESVEQYGLVNCWYGSLPQPLKKEMNISEDIPMVEMGMVDGYSVFDWAKVVENASVIYSVDTAINYIIEKINTSAKRYELYSRYTPANWHHIDGLFSTPWNYND